MKKNRRMQGRCPQVLQFRPIKLNRCFPPSVPAPIIWNRPLPKPVIRSSSLLHPSVLRLWHDFIVNAHHKAAPNKYLLISTMAVMLSPCQTFFLRQYTQSILKNNALCFNSCRRFENYWLFKNYWLDMNAPELLD